MRTLPILIALSLLAPAGLLASESGATLVCGTFAQRRADRYAAADGLPAGPVTDVELGTAGVLVWTAGGAARFSGGRWTPVKAERFDRYAFARGLKLPAGAVLRSAAKGGDGMVWAVTDRGTFRWDGKRLNAVHVPTQLLRHQPPADPDAKLSCVAVDASGAVWFGSDRGLFATDGADLWNPLDRRDGLPYEDVTALAFGPDGDLWVGTTEGVCRQRNGVWQYFWGPRWLPGNRVNALIVDRSGAAWVATDGGVARLWDQRITLAEKAAHYEEVTAARHNRRGFVYRARLRKPGQPDGGTVFEASDNDGLWTSLYVAAESFRYAATKDPKARALARSSMRALLDLVRYSGVPGFPARAIIREGEEVDGYDPDETVRIPGEKEKIWYRSSVDPKVLCKGDTSSDELDGHYFAWPIYYDLVADEGEKEEIRRTVQAVTDNILDHGLTLVGPTGRRTRWGVWDPHDLNEDPIWWEERGLNSLEILAYLKVADHICGLPRYRRKWEELVRKHHYLLNTVYQKIESPWWEVNHSDDEMAFMMYWSAMWYEKDSDTRRVLLQGLERSWQVERPEESPFFNFLYAACSQRPCEAERAVSTLQEWPWDLVEWEVRGTQRHDVTVRSHRGNGEEKRELTRVLPPGERPLMQWNGNPYEAEGGTPDGKSEGDGVAWLVSYWMGRYYGVVGEQGR